MVRVFVIHLSARLRHDAAHRRKPVGQRVTRTGLVCIFSLLHHVMTSFHCHEENLETAPKGSPKICTGNVTFNWRKGRTSTRQMGKIAELYGLVQLRKGLNQTMVVLIVPPSVFLILFFLRPFCLKNTNVCWIVSLSSRGQHLSADAFMVRASDSQLIELRTKIWHFRKWSGLLLRIWQQLIIYTA